MKRILYILVVICVAAVSAFDASAQEDRREVRKGNRRFKDGEYSQAVIEYMRALEKDSLSVAANYNIANALYRMEEYEKAKEALGRIQQGAPMTPAAADYFYNLGSVAMAMQDWQTAVQALQQSLLVNPGDMDAKENYIYAKKMLQNQQNQQNQQDQNQDQNQQDQNEDQQNQDQQNENQNQNQDQQNQQNQDQNNQDQNNQGQQPQITPQAAQQMLEAIQAKEKETQDKVKKAKAAALRSREREKNW